MHLLIALLSALLLTPCWVVGQEAPEEVQLEGIAGPNDDNCSDDCSVEVGTPYLLDKAPVRESKPARRIPKPALDKDFTPSLAEIEGDSFLGNVRTFPNDFTEEELSAMFAEQSGQ